MTEWVRKYVRENPGCRVALAGRTAADVRNTLVTGQSGLISISPESERPVYKMHTSSLEWPNGSTAMLLSSEVPSSARGPEFHIGAFDEFASWKNTLDDSGSNLYNNLLAGIRLGAHPRILMATTPKRTQVMKDLFERSKDPKQNIKIVRGSTLENSALSETFINNLLQQYGDTDLARQEIEGLMLEDSDGLVFNDDMILRAKQDAKVPPGLAKIIAVDPSVSADPKNSDECGIMVLASTRHADPMNRTIYLLEDASLRGTPDEWVDVVVETARKYGINDVVVEKNQGGALLTSVIKAKGSHLRTHLVWASKGKVKRMEPVVVLMQQNRIKMVDDFPSLEDQMIFYDPEDSKYSPDRLDAFVWGVTALAIDPPKSLSVGRIRGSKVDATLPTNFHKVQRKIKIPHKRRV